MSIGVANPRWRTVAPALAVLLAASLWGTIGTAYALYERHFDTDPMTIVTVRAVAAAAIVTGWVLARDRRLFAIAARDLPRFGVYGLVSVTAFYIVLIYSFRMTSVAVGTLLLYLAPVFVTLGAALLFGDQLTRTNLLALAVAFVGCLLIVEAFRPSNLSANALGIALGLLSAICYAAFSLMGKPLVARYRLATVVFWYLFTGVWGLLVVKLLVSPGAWPAWHETLVIGGYSGVFNTLAPVALYTWGLRHLPAAETSILATVEPVIAMMLAATVLGERLGWTQIGGAGCILTGVVLLTLQGRIQMRKSAKGRVISER